MSKTIEEITKISKDRAEKYGPARGNFQDTADLWNAYLGTTITAEQVGVMMALVKIARMKTSPGFLDHYVDAANYICLSGDIIQEDFELCGLSASEVHAQDAAKPRESSFGGFSVFSEETQEVPEKDGWAKAVEILQEEWEAHDVEIPPEELGALDAEKKSNKKRKAK